MPASPLLLLVPYRYKAAVLYSQIPISASASGDFVVSRAGDTASRILGNGNIETGVLANIARINYPRTGVASGCAGLLVEPAATNGILNSADTKTDWILGANLTSGYVDVIGVSGNNLTVAASGSGMAANAGALRRTSNNVALASGSTYTISFLMKKTGTHTIGAYYAVIGGLDLAAGFNVSGSFSSGQIFTNAFVTNRIRRVEQFGTDVYRCSETFTMTSGVTFTNLYIGPTVSTTANTNPAVGLGIAFAAPQIELGSLPTSFISTVASAVTRNSDVITNNQFVIPNLIGAILTEFESPTSGTYFVDNLPVTLVSGYNKVAISYTPTTITVYRNGTQVSGSPFSPPGGVLPILGNVINIGHNNQYYQLGANIRSFVLYSSTLTAAEASGLTT
jgi:hypothetical protein